MLENFEESVDELWRYHEDLAKRVEELNNKISFYRENLAIIKGGENQFGRQFFTNNQNRIDELGQLCMK